MMWKLFPKKKEPRIQAKKGRLIIPKTAQDTIPFKQIFANGVIDLGGGMYSKVCYLSNINYILARDEDKESIFFHYCNLLNSLDNGVSIQIFLNNVTVNEKELLKNIQVQRDDDSFVDLLKEYNTILRSKVDECHNKTAQKELFVAFTVTGTTSQIAGEKLSTYISNIGIAFKRMGSFLKEISVPEVLKIIYEFYNPRNRNKQDFFLHENLFTRGLDLKDIIAPSSFKFKINHYLTGDVLSRCIFIRDLPTSLRDCFISDILDCAFTLSISMHIEPTDPSKAIDSIRRRITGMESNKQQYTKQAGLTLEPYIPYELKTSLEEAKELLDSLTRKNKKLFYVSIYINVVADSLEELNERTSKVQAVCRRHLVNGVILSHQQEDGLASMLPIGKDVVKIKRTLLTDSTAVFMPYSSEDILDENGFYYGINQVSRSLIILNRKMLENPAGFNLGRPRSGKSFSSKREIVNVLLATGDDVLVIDPEAEYCTLCENFGGEVIKIAANSKNFINPLDMSEDYGAGESPVMLKSEFMLSIFECLLGSLKPVEKTIIDRCVRLVYQKFIDSGFNNDMVPTLKELHEILKNQKEEEAKNLALSIELYVSGSLNMFAHKTNINMNNRFTVFNTKDLGKQLKTLGMLNVLDFVWNRVCANWANKKRTWVYVDEFYMLFSSEYISGFFNEFFKRSQKRGGIPTGITQNVQEILASDTAKYMLSNSEFLMLFNQSPSDREELAKLLKISPLQMSYVIDPEEGAGIMINKGKVIPFYDKFPKETKLYKMMTTKVQDLF